MHEFIWDSRLKPFPLYLSVFTQIHEIIEAEEDPERTPFHCLKDPQSTYYFIKVANLLPPILSEKIKEEGKNEGSGWEETLEYKKEGGRNAMKEDGRVRPEFLLKKNNFLFNPDAYLLKKRDEGGRKEGAGKRRKEEEEKEREENENNEKEKKELIKLGREVGEEGVMSFLREVENLEVTPVSGEELCEMMHLRGINLRHLGRKNKKLKNIPYKI